VGRLVAKAYVFEDRAVVKMIEEQAVGSISAHASQGIGDAHELWV
jgi:hypothetical protein